MSYFRSPITTRTGREQILTIFRENSLIDHEKQTNKNFSLILRIFMWSISLGTQNICVHLKNVLTRSARFLNVNTWDSFHAMYNRKICWWGFRLTLLLCAVTCNICQATMHLFFRRHGDSRVRMNSDVHLSYIFEDINFKLKWVLQTSVRFLNGNKQHQ